MSQALAVNLRCEFWPHRLRERANERRQHASLSARPDWLGGGRYSGRVKAQAGLILRLLDETPEITIEELGSALATYGHRFGYGATQPFLHHHDMT